MKITINYAIPVITGMLGFVFGYKFVLKKNNNLKEQISDLKNQNDKIQEDLKTIVKNDDTATVSKCDTTWKLNINASSKFKEGFSDVSLSLIPEGTDFINCYYYLDDILTNSDNKIINIKETFGDINISSLFLKYLNYDNYDYLFDDNAIYIYDSKDNIYYRIYRCEREFYNS